MYFSTVWERHSRNTLFVSLNTKVSKIHIIVELCKIWCYSQWYKDEKGAHAKEKKRNNFVCTVATLSAFSLNLFKTGSCPLLKNVNLMITYFVLGYWMVAYLRSFDKVHITQKQMANVENEFL